MQRVSPSDKDRILDILCAAFSGNLSTTFIAGTGAGREKRIRVLMDYSVEMCRRYGAVQLSDDRSACALLLYPDRRRFHPDTLLLDLKLLLHCVGLRRLRKTLRREAAIKKNHPQHPFTYLWYIAVDPSQQGQGSGSQLLRHILEQSDAMERRVYLETSTERNLPWYQRAGFSIFHEEDFGYQLYFLRSTQR